MHATSRRGFLRGLAALAATSSMVPPAVALAPPAPVISDLQVLIDRTAVAGLRTLYLPPGTYSCPGGPAALPYRGVNRIIGARA